MEESTMKAPENKEQKSLADMLAKTNALLTAVVVLLTIGLVVDLLIYSSVINLPTYIYDGFNAIYKTIIQMRVY